MSKRNRIIILLYLSSIVLATVMLIGTHQNANWWFPKGKAGSWGRVLHYTVPSLCILWIGLIPSTAMYVMDAVEAFDATTKPISYRRGIMARKREATYVILELTEDEASELQAAIEGQITDLEVSDIEPPEELKAIREAFQK